MKKTMTIWALSALFAALAGMPPAYAAGFSADIKANGADNAITIPYGSGVVLSWTSNGANTCALSYFGAVDPTGTRTIQNISASKEYFLYCYGDGGVVTDSVMIRTYSAPSIADVRANGSDNRITIPYGSRAVLTWNSQDANVCYIAPPGITSASGFYETDSLYASRSYYLYCYGPGGMSMDVIRVTALDPPVGSSGVVFPSENTTIANTGYGSQSGQVLGAADVVTGPEDVLLWVLTLGFIGSLISYYFIFGRKSGWGFFGGLRIRKMSKKKGKRGGYEKEFIRVARAIQTHEQEE